MTNATSNSNTIKTVTVTVEYCKIGFARARDNNLNQHQLDAFEATRRAANWTLAKLVPQLELESAQAQVEEFLDHEVQSVRPLPTEASVRDYLSSAAPEDIRTAVHEVVGVLFSETRLEPKAREKLTVIARSFLPPIDEAWISKKFKATPGFKESIALKAVQLIMNDVRINSARQVVLIECLRQEIKNVAGTQQANEFIDEHTMPKRPARTSEVRALAAKPHREPSSRPLEIARSPEPTLKVVHKPNPLADLDQRISELKHEAKRIKRELNDGTGGSQEELEATEGQLKNAVTEREALMTSIAKAKQTERDARKSKNKKAEEPKKNSKQRAA